MSHDFEPTEAEKEMLSHIKDIEVNRKQSELGNIISGAILDGQNQIHDLYKEKATAQEVEYRMRRSYTYWMNKLHQELQKAREETEKAYGGCHYCYGKGYGTQTASWVGRGYYKKLPTMKFCTCERGKQLEQLLHSELDQPNT